MDFYGLTSCDTCRKARKWLDDAGIDYRYHDVRDDGVGAAELRRWADAVGWEALVNRRSLTWRNLPVALKDHLDREKALSAIVEHPTLLKRPVLEGSDVLEIGFRADRYAGIFAASSQSVR